MFGRLTIVNIIYCRNSNSGIGFCPFVYQYSTPLVCSCSSIFHFALGMECFPSAFLSRSLLPSSEIPSPEFTCANWPRISACLWESPFVTSPNDLFIPLVSDISSSSSCFPWSRQAPIRLASLASHFTSLDELFRLTSSWCLNHCFRRLFILFIRLCCWNCARVLKNFLEDWLMVGFRPEEDSKVLKQALAQLSLQCFQLSWGQVMKEILHHHFQRHWDTLSALETFI